ncbi:MAG: hypothetical protein CMC07_07905 [Flavobacteriaceae bacterium]|jgi:hypothetical protein|nr:hypothetical protein [Flavobacteriaceae bacterium]HBY69986.1 hypothetical protein [Flavobacteriaceae bacterium]|tara:strand:+ start:2430 stop:2951 length:522 start_codon:yes stop_codon:yes gene_type:complete
MEIEQLIGYVAYLLPAIVVGLVAYYFFKGHTANEEGRRRYLIQKEAQNKILPTRLQAYERLTLLLERIDPNKLLVRVNPYSDSIDDYEKLLIKNIEQEFEHNITQQVYVSVECWNIIQAAKNATIHIIRQAAMHEKENTADTMREWILRHFMEEVTPSQKALTYIKKEVSELF